MDEIFVVRRSRFLTVFRFIGVFFLAIFGFLALGTEITDIADMYFDLVIQPLESLIYAGMAYWIVFFGYLFLGGAFRDENVDGVNGCEMGCVPIFMFFSLVISWPFLSIVSAYEIFHNPESADLPFGEPDQWMSILPIFVAFAVIVNAFATSFVDWQRHKAQPSKGMLPVSNPAVYVEDNDEWRAVAICDEQE